MPTEPRHDTTTFQTEARAHYDAHEHTTQSATALARDLAAPLAARLHAPHGTDSSERTFSRHFGDTFPLRRIQGRTQDDQVELELTLDPATARAVIALLAECQHPHTLREQLHPYGPRSSYADLAREIASAHTMLDRAGVPRYGRSGTPWTVEHRIAWMIRRNEQSRWPAVPCSECGLDHLRGGCACTW